MLTKVMPGDMSVPVFGKLKSTGKAGFTDRDYGRFERAYSQLNTTEKKYFNAFCGFIAREQWLARVGEESSDTLNGNASLWRNSMDEKMQQFSMLSHLEILENRADQEEPSIIFKKTPRTNDLSNFRTGDIAVLYPAVSEKDTVLQHQVVRCTIVRIEKDQIEVQLRYRQKNLKIFETRGFWCLEPDMMDSGFVAMYRNLMEWAEAPPQVRSRVMGVAVKTPPDSREAPDGIVQKIMEAPGFFLLWGPPGTGKTSVVLRDLSAWILNQTDENLLLLAYTNRAVDEICEALESIGPEVRSHYLRIGSRHATAARFRDQLLTSRTADSKSRAELLKVLESHRIFVSTVASFGQQEALLKLKKFHRLVIDEASQILEPQLTGLLTHFEHFTLIGDHRQLPAVTAQRPENTIVNDTDLNEMGLTDLRDSYFERLYRLCLRNNWYWAYDQLDKQGRMHDEIMQFPGKWFYNGTLRVFDPQKQQITLPVPKHAVSKNKLGDLLSTRRVVFLPVKPDGRTTVVQKTSREEALLCARITVFFKDWWKQEKRTWYPDKTLGIITPWRAQIAQIQSALAEAGIKPGEVTIDTVERYQGGARDVIIVSTCANSEWQLASLVSLSTEGVDRKLNVALTRAREHLIMLGNPDVLGKDERYRAFMDLYGPDEI
jgi:DNA replication ATP-dependent helicase Dna2